jgi:hypothetical protein
VVSRERDQERSGKMSPGFAAKPDKIGLSAPDRRTKIKLGKPRFPVEAKDGRKFAMREGAWPLISLGDAL